MRPVIVPGYWCDGTSPLCEQTWTAELTRTEPARDRDLAKVFVIALALVLLAGAGAVAALVLRSRSTAEPPQGRVLVVETGSEREIRVTFQVDKDPAATAECDIGAFDEKGSSVGRLIRVPVGPAAPGQRIVSQTVVVATPLGAASQAAVATCRLATAG